MADITATIKVEISAEEAENVLADYIQDKYGVYVDNVVFNLGAYRNDPMDRYTSYRVNKIIATGKK